MVSLENWLSLQISQGGIFIPLYMLIGGFLASFLPCVYPIYPILVRVLVGSSEKEKSHSRLIAYVLGVILVYAILGGAFLLGGSLLQNVYRSPYTNFLFSFLIFLMIISLWEHIYVPLFSPKSDLSTEKYFVWLRKFYWLYFLRKVCCFSSILKISDKIVHQYFNTWLKLYIF